MTMPPIERETRIQIVRELIRKGRVRTANSEYVDIDIQQAWDVRLYRAPGGQLDGMLVGNFWIARCFACNGHGDFCPACRDQSFVIAGELDRTPEPDDYGLRGIDADAIDSLNPIKRGT